MAAKKKNAIIPTHWEGTLFVYLVTDGWQRGSLEITEYEWKTPDDRVLVHQFYHSFDIPQTDEDGIRQKMVKNLQGKKEEILAKAHQEAQDIQDKIDNLLAITYQAAE